MSLGRTLLLGAQVSTDLCRCMLQIKIALWNQIVGGRGSKHFASKVASTARFNVKSDIRKARNKIDSKA